MTRDSCKENSIPNSSRVDFRRSSLSPVSSVGPLVHSPRRNLNRMRPCYTSPLLSRFADGECSVTIDESVMGKDVFVVSPTHSNDSLIEMLLVIGAARR